jgi:hypothetical protein
LSGGAYVTPEVAADGGWSQTEAFLFSPKDAKTAVIWFGASRLRNFAGTTFQIDNVSLFEVETTLANPEETFSNLQALNFSKVSPTKYVAEITANSSFVLALVESYNPSWVCYVNNQKIESFNLYNSINGFNITETGSLELVVEYEPQKLYTAACYVSLATFCVCGLFLALVVGKSLVSSFRKNKS